MYLIKEEKKDDIKKFRTSYYSQNTGLNVSYLSSILNANQKCTEITARAILSACLEIPVSDEKMPELLNEYFREE